MKQKKLTTLAALIKIGNGPRVVELKFDPEFSRFTEKHQESNF